MLQNVKSRVLNGANQTINYGIVAKLDTAGTKVYSINIQLIHNKDNGKSNETNTTAPLTASLRQAQQLLVYLYNNTVMPVHLDNVVDNYISDNPNFVFEEEPCKHFVTAMNLQTMHESFS